MYFFYLGKNKTVCGVVEVGLNQLKKLDMLICKRREAAKKWDNCAFGSCPWSTPKGGMEV